MTLRDYGFTHEPRGAVYRRLLERAVGRCQVLVLVIRDGLGTSQACRHLVDLLEPYVIAQERSDRWPGTQLFGHTAQVLTIRFGAEVAELLMSSADGLFDWRQPDRPEDLSLLRDDERPWLTSISHERYAYFSLTEDELAELVEDVPQLGSIDGNDD